MSYYGAIALVLGQHHHSGTVKQYHVERDHQSEYPVVVGVILHQTCHKLRLIDVVAEIESTRVVSRRQDGADCVESHRDLEDSVQLQVALALCQHTLIEELD
jgi:hypothetical protein